MALITLNPTQESYLAAFNATVHGHFFKAMSISAIPAPSSTWAEGWFKTRYNATYWALVNGIPTQFDDLHLILHGGRGATLGCGASDSWWPGLHNTRFCGDIYTEQVKAPTGMRVPLCADERGKVTAC